MKIINRISLLGFALLALVALNCKKTGITIPPAQAHFVGSATQSYDILVDPVPTYNVVVGTTDVSSSDRSISYSITSPTGALAGTNYTVNGKPGVVTIPAGQATANIEVQGILAPYLNGRKDILVFAVAPGGIAPAGFQDTVKLNMRGPCFEGDVDFNLLAAGSYSGTTETFGANGYGPYETGISSFTLLTPTTATIKVSNIFDFGWKPITFNVDWTDPAHRTVTVVPQTSGIADAGTINSAYAGLQVAVRAFPGETGTFSACKETFTLKFQLGVAGLGYFTTDLYTVNMAR
ncbi:MAG TPA: hypothetical protein VK644_11550 [Chitinophagaceae bacterium]|nr:hypothetical protein [Chitinophagaceae bacterium]